MDQTTAPHLAPEAVTVDAVAIGNPSAGSDSETLLDEIVERLPDAPEALLLGEYGGVIILVGLIATTILLLAMSASGGLL